MYRAELYLTDYDQVRLEEFRFFDPQSSKPLVTFNGGSSSYCIGASKNLFTWTVGVRAVTALLLKSALFPSENVSISGEGKSLAASLDHALSKEPEWLIDFFGITGRGSAIARKLFGRRNSERKRPGPVEVYLNDSLLPGSNIRVFLNQTPATVDQLTRMLRAFDDRFRQTSEKTTTSLSSASDSAVTQAMERDFPLTYWERTVAMKLNYEQRKAFVTLESFYTNTSEEPVNFVHYNVRVDEPNGLQNINVTCPDEPTVAWKPVITDDGRARIIVNFQSPLQPGEKRLERFEYELHNYDFTEARLDHVVRVSTGKLTLQVSCNAPHRVSLASLFAEENNNILFASIPQPKLKTTRTGESSATWTMTNPPHGYRFQLFWGTELRSATNKQIALDATSTAAVHKH